MQAQAEQDSSGTGMSREIKRQDTPGLTPGCDEHDRLGATNWLVDERQRFVTLT